MNDTRLKTGKHLNYGSDMVLLNLLQLLSLECFPIEIVEIKFYRSSYNELPEPQTRPLILRFTDQLTHFMALLLWVAGILAFISQTPESDFSR